jgi:hypothetical protein
VVGRGGSPGLPWDAAQNGAELRTYRARQNEKHKINRKIGKIRKTQQDLPDLPDLSVSPHRESH